MYRGGASALPATLREFQFELAGKLALSDDPGAEIKAVRERYGFTQEWLSQHLGIRRESLSRIEGGHVQISVPFIQLYSRIVTLAKGVREHLASVESRRGIPDETFLAMVASSLRLDRDIADDVVLVSMINYEHKRRQAVRDLRRAGKPTRL